MSPLQGYADRSWSSSCFGDLWERWNLTLSA